MKIAVIGNTNWQNKRKIRDALYKLKQMPNVTVLGAGGREGANHMVRKFALEFGLDYQEYNPSFSGHNMYSALSESYFGKRYHFSQLHHRMKLLAQACDKMIIFTNESLDPVLKTAKNNADRQNKPVVIIE